MSLIKRALPESFDTTEFDLGYNPVEEVITFPSTASDRLFDALAQETAHKEWELSKYTSRELQDELTRRDK